MSTKWFEYRVQCLLGDWYTMINVCWVIRARGDPTIHFKAVKAPRPVQGEIEVKITLLELDHFLADTKLQEKLTLFYKTVTTHLDEFEKT